MDYLGSMQHPIAASAAPTKTATATNRHGCDFPLWERRPPRMTPKTFANDPTPLWERRPPRMTPSRLPPLLQKAFESVIHPPNGFSTSHFGFFEGSRARHKIHHAQITCSLTLKINRVGHHCQSSAFEQALCAGHVVGRGGYEPPRLRFPL